MNVLTSIRPMPIPARLLEVDKDSANDPKVSARAPDEAASNSKRADDAEKPSADASVKQQQKTVVDQRTIDAGSVQVTVISYSDGSSETLEKIKNAEQFGLSNSGSEKLTSPPPKGVIVDKFA
ncbi:hypothetical protein U5A82_00750 [Sphingobium sp. CR2-8]|uniref:hypothetical protein n=1 Tax=Sphingobium sp. CR2-8 TaxID=1306534 RepID=UPI002DBB50C0|nr:hypothetical protein [Sphingobium sp. CR2-8]MEC3909049.1 hypothetical protein [Sphingobium sp. CR2-8]